VREHLGAEQLVAPETGHCIANLTYVFNHHQRELAARMTRLSHDHHDLTISTLHVHLDHDNCMETLVLSGPVARVRRFADQVIAQPGVHHGKLYLLPVTNSDEAHRHGDFGPSQPHRHQAPIA
jgi:CopG family nickel-responsive transcriptional regulator